MFDSRKHSFADYIDCRNLEHEAYELLNQKSYEQALEVIQEALQINPEDDRCCFMEGLIYATMSKEVDFSYIEGARISFDKALALNPDVEAYKVARSSCLFEMAKYYYSSSDPSTNSLALSFINDYLRVIEDNQVWNTVEV